MKDGTVWIDGKQAVDLDDWNKHSPKVIRQFQASVVHFGVLSCPKCGKRLLLNRTDFTIKRNGTCISDNPIQCAKDSKSHGYRGGCGHSFHVKLPAKKPNQRK